MPDRNIGHENERRAQQGMTLLEVTFAISIFIVAILCAMSALMSTITTNRLMTANATANAAILRQKEEIQEIAASDIDAPAAAIVKHYAELADIDSASGANGIAVGSNGSSVARVRWDADNRGLVYTFEIPGPADSIADDAPFNRGFGEMLIYLNETGVPVDWNDLGESNAGSVGGGTGYDINGDDTIENHLTEGAKNDLANGNFESFNAAVGPVRLPIDISVRYFTDAAHSKLFYDTTRRSVFVGLSTAWQD